MLSPRKFAAGKKFLQRSQKARKRQNQRTYQLELLDKRELLAADIAAPLALEFETQQAIYSTMDTSSLQAEGESRPLVVTEVEPNNLARSNAQFINVGTLSSQSTSATINGQLQVTNTPTGPGWLFDEDYYAVDLRAGDIFQASISNLTSNPSLIFLDSNLTELMGATANSTRTIYPPSSPLVASAAKTELALVIPATGRYYVRVGDAAGIYNLQLKAFRNTIEQEPIGTKQIIFLDFDGEIFNGSVFADADPTLQRTVRLPSMIDTLMDYGFNEEDEDALIDKIIAVLKEKFITDLSTLGGNGYYGADGKPGSFDIEFRNSRDHADPWGQKNVSRVIIGGGSADFTAGLAGLAQSIDVGNFVREETTVFLPGTLFEDEASSVSQIPRSASKTLLDVTGVVSGNIIAHEVGHILGLFHQDSGNTVNTVMDAGPMPFSVDAGVGRDGIFGTADDERVSFGRDRWAPSEGYTGRYNQALGLSYTLSTGTVGASLTGNIYNDLNRNGAKDSSEPGLAGWEVYADLNNNGVRESNEPRTVSTSTGSYSLGIAPGQYTIRVTRPAEWLPSTTADVARTINVTSSGAVLNFGSYAPSNTVTGYKWLDLNENGIRDQGEPGIEGVYIYIDLDGDDRPDVGEPGTLTKADGSYILTPPYAGTFTIREVVGAGMSQTFPANGEHTFVYNGTNLPHGLDFGNSRSADYGDAPAPYPTTQANNGASHGRVDGLRLGANWDAESDGIPSANADGDNNSNINDEDGVVVLTPIVRGDSSNMLQINVINTTGTVAYIQGWIDFNGNGSWGDAGEQILVNYPVTSSGTYNVTFTTPANATSTTFARFRLSHQQGLGPAGAASGGEVEDYKFNIVNGPRTLLQPDSATVSRNSANNPIDVLANDFAIPGDSWTITGVSSGQRGGRVTFDPATNVVNYTPALSFIGIDEFTYTARSTSGRTETARVTVNVVAQFANPIAVDDSFDVPTNSIGYPLNVLANDIEGQGGALVVTNVTTPSQGGSVTIGSGGQSIRYTPRRDFGGTETFQYTATDSTGKTSTGRITVHVTPGSRSDDTAEFSFAFFNMAGEPISEVRQGEQFRVAVYIDDLRPELGRQQVPPVNITDPGVYAAYLDVLYSAGLVAPAAATAASPLDFEASFSAPYVTGFEGTAAVPGIIDEFGAYVGSVSSMNHPDKLLLGTMTFTATNPGLAEFIGDPADMSPQTDVVFFNTDRRAVPISEIRYGRSMIEVVPAGVSFPYAKDDSPGILPAGQSSVINVLANDITGTQPPIRITAVTQPASGQVQISDNGTPSNYADDTIIYTPNTNFVGTDSFTYTVTDAQGFTSKATVTLNVGTQAQIEADDVISLRLSVTNLQGQPIDQIVVGSQFQLRGYVDDLRTNPPADGGVFAAFQDILYNSNLVSVNTSGTAPFFDVTYSTDYNTSTSGDIRIPGLINEIGSAQTSGSPLGSAERLQFVITLTARATGVATFIGDPADIKPFHDTLFYQPTGPIPTHQIRYSRDSVTIVGAATGGGAGEGLTNLVNAYDVNNDGYVSPIDALILINQLNSQNRSRSLDFDSQATGEDAPHYYVDVDGDGSLSPLDALSVINYINNAPRVTQDSLLAYAGGEGEATFANTVELATPLITGKAVLTETEQVPVSEDEFESTVSLIELYSPADEFESNEVDDVFSLASFVEDDKEDEDEDDFITQLASGFHS